MRQMRNDMTGRFGRVLSETVLQGMKFSHACDLWRPVPVAVGASKAAGDQSYEAYAEGQACTFSATTETDAATVMGRSNSDNLYTLDKFLFPNGVPVEDGWVIKFIDPGGDNDGQYWMVRGNPQSLPSHPFHPAGEQLVYATQITTRPPGVE